MKLTGAILIILAAGLLFWSIFSTNHPFLAFPVGGNASGTTPQTGTHSASLYFANAVLDSTSACPKIVPIERNIDDTPAIIRDTIRALVAGPTTAEKEKGYRSPIDSGAGLQSLRLEDGLVSLDFDRPLLPQSADLCDTRTARAEIEATLHQFPSVTTVMISSNGQPQQ